MRKLLIGALLLSIVRPCGAYTLPESDQSSPVLFVIDNHRQAMASGWFFTSLATLGTAYYLDKRSLELRSRADLTLSWREQGRLRTRADNYSKFSTFFLVASGFTAAFGFRDIMSVNVTTDNVNVMYNHRFK